MQPSLGSLGWFPTNPKKISLTIHHPEKKPAGQGNPAGTFRVGLRSLQTRRTTSTTQPPDTVVHWITSFQNELHPTVAARADLSTTDCGLMSRPAAAGPYRPATSHGAQRASAIGDVADARPLRHTGPVSGGVAPSGPVPLAALSLSSLVTPGQPKCLVICEKG